MHDPLEKRAERIGMPQKVAFKETGIRLEDWIEREKG